MRPQRHGDDDRLDVLVADHVLPLGVVFRRWALRLREDLVRLRELIGIDVGEREDLRVGGIDLRQQHAAFAAEADEADSDGPASDWPFQRRRCPEPCQRRDAGHRFQEVPSSDRLLFRSELHLAPR